MTKPILLPPSKRSETSENKNKGSETLVLILSGIIICLVLIMLALVLLPSSFQDKTQKNKDLISKTVPEEKHQVKIINNDEKIFNENIKIDWMLKKSDAENINMPVWSNEDYKEALAIAEKAELFKQDKQFDLANKHYNKAIAIIEKVLEGKEQIQNELIEKANTALEKENLNEAKQLFEQAQSIDANNDKILKGLYRLENRNEVNKIFLLVNENENNQHLDTAIKNLQRILSIEQDHRKAKDKLIIIKDKKSKIDYDNAINETLNALENNNLKKAQQTLTIAKNINSSDPVISELTIRINEETKSIAINSLQNKAINLEKKEHWQSALDSYRNILKYDPDTSNALINVQRVKLYIKINELLDNIILKSERLQDDNILNSSNNTLVYIESEYEEKQNFLYPLSKTPNLAKKIITAKKLLSEASRDIPVTIKSDNETDIVIYKIGKFGKLNEKSIYLKPGRYTIVGKRDGYRDFRKLIQIKASDQLVNVNVLCREKI